MNCPNCSGVLAERGCFCKSCGSQARCLNCRDVLEPEAVACVECGTRIGDRGAGNAPSTQVGQPALPHRNTLSYQEDRTSRTFSASLTDSAIQGLGDTLSEFFAQRGGSRAAGELRQPFQKAVAIGHPKEIAAPAADNGAEPVPPSAAAPPQAAPPQPPGTDDKARIVTLFRPNGSTLDLIDNRLKGKNGLHYVARLTYLFLYAHELHGRNVTPKAEVLAVLKDAKVLDSNSRNWLTKKKGFKMDPEDRLELIGPGRDAAKKALEEALDPNTPDEWNPDTKSTKPRAPRKKA
jgi:hypothetical protein